LRGGKCLIKRARAAGGQIPRLPGDGLTVKAHVGQGTERIADVCHLLASWLRSEHTDADARGLGADINEGPTYAGFGHRAG